MYVLSVIFPCYNESSNIVGIISSMKSALQGRNDVEIILVDNGSTDSTPQVLEQVLQGEHNKQFKTLKIENNIGYGHGIMEGVRIASGEVIAWTHADLQTDPADVLEAYKTFVNHRTLTWNPSLKRFTILLYYIFDFFSRVINTS